MTFDYYLLCFKFSQWDLFTEVYGCTKIRRKPFRRYDNWSDTTFGRCDISPSTTFGRKNSQVRHSVEIVKPLFFRPNVVLGGTSHLPNVIDYQKKKKMIRNHFVYPTYNL